MNEKQRSHPWTGGILLLGAFVVMLGGQAALAGEHHEGGHSDEGKAETAKAELDNYSAAVAAIDKHRAHVGELIERKKLAELHKAAKPIQLLAKKLVGLALKEGSGVPRESLKEVNLTAKALAKTWAKIDEAGDAGDLAASKKVYEEIVSLINTLKKYAPSVKEEHHGEEGHEEGETPTKAEQDNYSAAVAAIDKHRAHVGELIERKKLAELHKAAKPIQLLAEKLNGLALKEGSGVPRESLKEVNLTSKALAKTWAKIDEAGDGGDLAASKKVYQEMIGLINTLKKFAPPVKEEDHEEEGHHEEDGHKKEVGKGRSH